MQRFSGYGLFSCFETWVPFPLLDLCTQHRLSIEKNMIITNILTILLPSMQSYQHPRSAQVSWSWLEPKGTFANIHWSTWQTSNQQAGIRIPCGPATLYITQRPFFSLRLRLQCLGGSNCCMVPGFCCYWAPAFQLKTMESIWPWKNPESKQNHTIQNPKVRPEQTPAQAVDAVSSTGKGSGERG